MFRHPTKSKSIINQPDNKQVQPNTIDLRVSKIFEIATEGNLEFGEKHKVVRSRHELLADSDGFFVLEPFKVYEVESTTYIKVAEGEAGIVLGRSTYNRNGVMIISSVYDSGFEDFVGATLYNTHGVTKIEHNSRFAHLLIFDAEVSHLYAGSYGKQNPPKSAMMTTSIL